MPTGRFRAWRPPSVPSGQIREIPILERVGYA